jgi:hypothetical protein
MTTCAYCGNDGHRSMRCQFARRTDLVGAGLYLGWAAVIIVLAVAFSGCTVAGDSLCQAPRPRAALNDTAGTRMAQEKAGKLWDSRCTVRGWVDR